MKYSFNNGDTIDYGRGSKAKLIYDRKNHNKCYVSFEFINREGDKRVYTSDWYIPSEQEYAEFGDGVFDRVWEDLLIKLSISVMGRDKKTWYTAMLGRIRSLHFGKENFHGRFEV